LRKKGIVRQVDQLGRIVLPVALRQYFDIGFKDYVEIFNDGNYILIKKHEFSCFLCGNTEKVVEVKMICTKCIKEIQGFIP
jgi:transcriptional pleiotropic regulator of transition state genes